MYNRGWSPRNCPLRQVEERVLEGEESGQDTSQGRRDHTDTEGFGTVAVGCWAVDSLHGRVSRRAYAVWALMIPKVNLYRCTYDGMSMNKEVWTIHNLALARELIMSMGLYWPFVLFNNEKQSPILNKHNLNQSLHVRVVWHLYKVGYFLNRLLGPFGFTLLDKETDS